MTASGPGRPARYQIRVDGVLDDRHLISVRRLDGYDAEGRSGGCR